MIRKKYDDMEELYSNISKINIKDNNNVAEMYCNLSTLPIYILSIIIDNIDISTWCRLRMTCKNLYYIKELDRKYISRLNEMILLCKIDLEISIFNKGILYKCVACNKSGVFARAYKPPFECPILMCCKYCHGGYCNKTCIKNHTTQCYFNCTQCMGKCHIDTKYICLNCNRNLCNKCNNLHEEWCGKSCGECSENIPLRKFSNCERCIFCDIIMCCDNCKFVHYNNCYENCSICVKKFSKKTNYYKMENNNRVVVICTDCRKDISIKN